MTPNRSRARLLLIAAVFAAPLIVAYALFASGWRPQASRNHGFLYAPAQDFRQVSAHTASGDPIVWENRERRWHLLLVAPAACDARCADTLDTVRRVWVGLGRHAGNVDLYFVGRPDMRASDLLAGDGPFNALTLQNSPLPAASATGAGLPVYLIDPHGYLVMRYDAGFEPGGLRRDLQRLLR